MKRLGKPAFNRLGMQGLPYGFGSSISKSYTKKILTPNADVGYDPSSLIGYWPLNEASGGIAYDHSPEGNDGAYAGVTLGHPGIGDGLTCPLFDGTNNDFVNLWSAGFAADYDQAELSAQLWFKVQNAGVWTDSTLRKLARFYVDADNTLYIQRNATDNEIGFKVEHNTVNRFGTWVTAGQITWLHIMVTISELNDRINYYGNGGSVSLESGGLGVWAGPLGNTQTLLGALSTAGFQLCSGYQAHCAVWTAEHTPAVVAYLAEA